MISRVLLVFTLVVIVSPLTVLATDLPQNWPWRSIVMNSFEAKKSDVALLVKKLSINHISLHIKTRLRSKRFKIAPDIAWEQELNWAEGMLDACAEVGVTATLVNSYFPIDPKYGLTQSSPEFWETKKHINDLLHYVQLMSKRFHSRGSELSSYQFLAEPQLRRKGKVLFPPNWPRLRDDIIALIRRHDPKRWVTVTMGPGGGFSGYQNVKPIKAERIIYCGHAYQPHYFTHQGLKNKPIGIQYPSIHWKGKLNKDFLKENFEPMRQFQNKHNVLVWIGEFSSVRWANGAEDYIQDAVSLFNSYGWSWSYFMYKGAHMWNPDYNTVYSTSDRKEWTKCFVGDKSTRWQTLDKIYYHNK